MKDEKGKKDKGGEVSAQSQTYTQAQIDAMSDQQVAEIAAANNIEAEGREAQEAALRAAGIVIHG